MLRFTPAALLFLLAACGQSGGGALDEAANQSGPAAASVLENAAENGMNPQEALEQAGQAQLNAADPNSTVQARPNLPQDPNRPPAGQPVDTVDVEANAAAGNGQ